tara:strand:+ start:1682 stop:1978 length:297 start_codon:yes stop_codon:yes gene_type:complete
MFTNRRYTARRRPWDGWDKLKPKTKEARNKIIRKCGRKPCFVGTKRLGFPVCSRFTRACRADKRGLWSAYIRAQGLYIRTKKRKYRTIALRAYRQLNR